MHSSEIKTFDFKDICITEFDEAFDKFQSSNTPLSRLARVSIQGVSSCHFDIFLRENSHPSIQECALPADTWVLHWPHPALDAIARYQQHPEGLKHSLIGLPDSEIIWHVAGATPSIGVAIRSQVLQALFSDSELDALSGQAHTIQRSQLNPGQLQSAGNSIIELLQQFNRIPEKQQSDHLQLTANDLSIHMINALLESQNRPSRISNRERILTRALDYIRQNYTGELRLIDIVNHAHTTTRNLQIVFKSQVGLTPLQYIKRYRLMQFHKGLRQYGTVTEAAIFSGLRHMGRLSDEYRKLFGENPGDYLNRRKDAEVNWVLASRDN